MTGTKGHSGGKREGQGRKPKPGKKYLVTIRCTEEEYRFILENTTPETRAELLQFPPDPLDYEQGKHDHSMLVIIVLIESITAAHEDGGFISPR